MNLTSEDFMHLHSTSMEWGNHWKKQAERFEPSVEQFNWRWAYWFESYTALLLAREFIEQDFWASETFFDMACGEWLLLTNYESYESKGDEDEEESLCENCRATVAQGAGKGKGRRKNGV